MKKVILFSTCITAAATMAACGGPGAKGKAAADTAAAETKAVPEYTVINNATVDLAGFPQDKDGYYVIFDGKTFNGWRGYGKDHVPSKWTIDNGAIKFNGSGGGEAQDGDGGDLIFTHKFKNFELEVLELVREDQVAAVAVLGFTAARTVEFDRTVVDRPFRGHVVFAVAAPAVERLAVEDHVVAVLVLRETCEVYRRIVDDRVFGYGFGFCRCRVGCRFAFGPRAAACRHRCGCCDACRE